MNYAEYFTDIIDESDIQQITKLFEDNKSDLLINTLEKIWTLKFNQNAKKFNKFVVDLSEQKNKIDNISIEQEGFNFVKLSNLKSVQEPKQQFTFGPGLLIGPMNIFYLDSKLDAMETIWNLKPMI